MDIQYIITEVVPVSRTRTQVRIITRTNPNLKFLPLSVLNFFSRKLGLSILEKINKNGKEIKGPVWEKKIKESKIFYDWLSSKVEGYFKTKNI